MNTSRSFRAETLKGHLDSLLLAVVRERAEHGYAIIDELRRRSGGVLDLPEGTIYPALHRLEESGLLRSRWADAGGRRRRVYSLTRKGVAALVLERATWRTFSAAVTAVLGAGA